MREHPIIFNTEMVKAYLAGRKTMTRRVIKPQPVRVDDAFDGTWEWREPKQYYDDLTLYSMLKERCPYGQAGDRLWVKESLRHSLVGIPVRYMADDCPVLKDGETPDNWNWKKPILPSIFMPRWACRTTPEITEVRVERVQDISESNALAEGIEEWEGFFREYDHSDKNPGWTRDIIYSFETLWDSLNAKRGYGWDTNCLVRVISFKKIS